VVPGPLAGRFYFMVIGTVQTNVSHAIFKSPLLPFVGVMVIVKFSCGDETVDAFIGTRATFRVES